MEQKKNPQANVGRNSSLYFAIGLTLILFLTYYAINLKTYDEIVKIVEQPAYEDVFEEDIPITQLLIQPPPPPPPPPVQSEVIQVVEDDVQIEETKMKSTEVDQKTEVVRVEHVVAVEEVEEEFDVPFAVIEDSPVFPGCEKGDKAAKKACMSEKIDKFVRSKFNTDLASDLGLTGRQRINVIFKIDKSGNIVDIKSRAPHPALEKEAARVINMLPKMQPGKQRGKPVTVQYTLPILFQVQ